MARIIVSDQEQALVAKAREIAKLQAKRRQIVDELHACDQAIAEASEALRGLTPSGTQQAEQS